eukprot:5633968-Amphidinium_carterae.1
MNSFVQTACLRQTWNLQQRYSNGLYLFFWGCPQTSNGTSDDALSKCVHKKTFVELLQLGNPGLATTIGGLSGYTRYLQFSLHQTLSAVSWWSWSARCCVAGSVCASTKLPPSPARLMWFVVSSNAIYFLCTACVAD